MRSMLEQAVAEFLGTLALVFIGAGSVVLAFNGLGGGLLGVALAHGLVLAVMVSSLGHISGGHFNPAVTIGAWIALKIETVRVPVYLVAQIAGAIAGAALLRWSLPPSIWKAASLGATVLNDDLGINLFKGILIEAILTFFLVLTVFATAIDDRGVFSSVAGLPIGFVLAFDILAAGSLTGASMNPARTLGPAIVGGTYTDLVVYLAGPVSGAILAAVIYWGVFLRGRDVVAPRTDTPIGGGPEEDLVA